MTLLKCRFGSPWPGAGGGGGSPSGVTANRKYSFAGFTEGPFTTDPVTLAAGTLVTLAISSFATISVPPTGTGLTFTLVGSNDNDPGDRELKLYRTKVPPGGFTGTISFCTTGEFVCGADLVQWDGALATGTNGADGIVQFDDPFPSDTAAAVSIPYPQPFASPNNAGYGFFQLIQGSHDYTPYTPETGWTLGLSGAAVVSLERSNEASTIGFTATLNDYVAFGLVIEIAAA